MRPRVTGTTALPGVFESPPIDGASVTGPRGIGLVSPLSLPTLPLQLDETIWVASEHKAGRTVSCWYREWDFDPRYKSDWCINQAGIFTSVVLESAAAGPKYQLIALTALSKDFVPSLFIPPASPTRHGA